MNALRISLFPLFILTAVVAVLAATNNLGIALAVFIAFTVTGLVVYGALQLRHAAAIAVTPFLYQRGLLGILRFTCGRELTVHALAEYGVELYRREEHPLAYDVFTRALELNKRLATLWANRGATLYLMGDYQRAADDLNKAIDLDGTDQMSRFHRGMNYMALGNYSESLQDLMHVECKLKDDAMTAYYRGKLHETFGDWQNAMNDFNLAYTLDASLTSAGVSLARIQGGCPDPAFRNGSKAVENALLMYQRKDADIWVTSSVLAAAYAEQGDFEQALKFAKIAWENAPENEKAERWNRILEYENRQPFRISVPVKTN